MPVKLVFLVAAVAGAVSSAVLAGLIVMAAAVYAGMPGEAAVTLTADTTAAVFGAVIALAGITAGLFLSGPDTSRQDNRVIPPARRHDAPAVVRAPGLPIGTSADSRLRAAVEARALILHPTRTAAELPGLNDTGPVPG